MNHSVSIRLIRTLTLGYLISAVAVFILSWALYIMKWEGAGSAAAIRVVYFISCLGAGFLSGKEFRERRLLWGCLSGILYALILLTISQLTGGLGNSAIMETVIVAGICVAGGAVGSIFS